MVDFQVRQLLQQAFINIHVPMYHFEASVLDELAVAGNTQPVLITEAGVIFGELLLRKSQEVEGGNRAIRMTEVIRGIDQVQHQTVGLQEAKRLLRACLKSLRGLCSMGI